MSTVAEILASPERRWTRNAPATDCELAQLRAELPFQVPSEYIEFLRVCNGGEGELALPPLWFQLFDTTFALELWRNDHYRRNFPALFFFGGNGGLESIAIDLRVPDRYPIVMVDCIAGLESAKEIARNMREFIEAIGLVNDNVAQPRH